MRLQVPLGRVTVRLGQLHADTVHDLWLPLQSEPHEYTTALGFLRVRLTLTWHKPLSAMGRYVQPAPRQSFDVVLHQSSDLPAAQYAVFGPACYMFDPHAALRTPWSAPWDGRFSAHLLADHSCARTTPSLAMHLPHACPCVCRISCRMHAHACPWVAQTIFRLACLCLTDGLLPHACMHAIAGMR